VRQPERGSDTDGGERAAPRARPRPTPDETFAAAVEIATRGSSVFKRFARRYSLCAADAEDAYQRSLEILLQSAPTADRTELRAWLHTVVKHEALAVRRQRERALPAAEPLGDPAEAAPALDEQASERERVHQTADALAHLKPSETRCLLLKALGYSYVEIAERTGYSWTKVNRSLTEGRRRFLERFGDLASGERCGQYQALLSTVCDGEASDEDARGLRTHLARCGGCRAALRSYRSATQRLAELFPPGALVGLSEQQGWWARLTDALQIGVGDRAGALAWKLQQGAEAISAQKAAAVVASTAAIAGGATLQTAPHDGRHLRSHAHAERTAGAKAAAAAPVPAPTPVPAHTADPDRATTTDSGAADRSAEAQPAEEFAPAPADAPAPPPVEAEVSSEFAGPATAGGGAAGGGEFGP
jgi:RNA polymerase sigma factor (sigma-70 family)